MRQLIGQTLFWSGLYLLAALAFLVVALFPSPPAGRGFWIELGVGLGIVGFAMWALQFVTTARFKRIASYFGSDAVLLFHRQAGILTALIVLAHPVVLVAAKRDYLEFFDPRVNFLRAVALITATIAIVLLIVLSLWREKVGLNYEWWRVSHAGLSVLVLFIGLVHSWQVGHYVDGIAKRGFWVAATVVAVGLLGYLKFGKPWRSKSTPYRVAEIRPERGDVWILVLTPDGHPGLRFDPGQFVWITVGETPFTLQQHPFSFCSSAESPQQLEFAVKNLGDFTSTIEKLTPGTKAFVEGPYGNFTLDPQAEAAVFIMGGIGVTPSMSILRSLRDRGDRRRLLMIYANNEWDEVAFRDELESLQESLNLQVVHVLSDPHEGWTGETGYLTPELMERLLADVPDKSTQYFICGPAPMMDLAEKGLRRRGVDPWRMLSERFDIV